MEVKQSCNKNESNIKVLETEVEKLMDKVEQQAELLIKVAANSDSGVQEEVREREARKMNVLIYGMGKA